MARFSELHYYAACLRMIRESRICEKCMMKDKSWCCTCLSSTIIDDSILYSSIMVNTILLTSWKDKTPMFTMSYIINHACWQKTCNFYGLLQWHHPLRKHWTHENVSHNVRNLPSCSTLPKIFHTPLKTKWGVSSPSFAKYWSSSQTLL